MNTTATTNTRQQNFMHALRLSMGLPLHRLVHDSIAFTFGGRLDFAQGIELARIAQAVQQDAIYVCFPNASANRPIGFSIAFRELDMVDVINNCVPFAESSDAPVKLVNIKGGEHFSVDRRGALVRVGGKPANLAAGKKRAMARIRAATAAMGDAQMAGCQTIPAGADPIIEPRNGPIVCFS
ncbi:MAG: hypothetical protein ACK4ZW_03090 [Blastomonas sp.]